MITQVMQTQESRTMRGISVGTAGTQKAKQDKTQKHSGDAKMGNTTGTANTETGVTVSFSEEGLDLSKGCVIQKDSEEQTDILQTDTSQNDYEKSMYQEMLEGANDNADALGEVFTDMGKALEIARRILSGDIVPKEDEQFLMEYDNELYMRVKSMAQQKDDPKEYDSLMEEEEGESHSEGNGTTIDGSNILDGIVGESSLPKMAVSV